MKTTMFRRLAITAAVAAPIALSTSLASASGWTQTNTSTVKSLAYSFASSGSKSTTYAGRKFAIGYTSSSGANVKHFPTVHAASGFADGHVDIPVSFFGKDAHLFSANATGDVISSTFVGAKPSFHSKYDVRLGGSIVKSGSINPGFNGTLATFTKTLLTTEATVIVYGFPVSFTAEATGTVYLKGSLAWSSGKLTVGVTPGANVDANGTAAVGGSWHGVGLKGGVEANMAVLDASIPLSGSMMPLASAMTVGAKGSLALSGMSGNFGVFAEACAGVFGCLHKSLPIFSWSGASYSVPAFNVTKTITL